MFSFSILVFKENCTENIQLAKRSAGGGRRGRGLEFQRRPGRLKQT